MLKKQALFVLCTVGVVSLSSAYAGEFKVRGDSLVFPDNTTLYTAPRDGKSILSGHGAPTIVGNVGDMYVDLDSKTLYGPYAGAWGTGVSLAGAPGPKGDTGPAGPAGICIAPPANPTTTTATIPHFLVNSGWKLQQAAATDLSPVFNIGFWATGNISASLLHLGSSNSSGVVAFSYMGVGTVGAGKWQTTTINGNPAILVDASPMRNYGVQDFFFILQNGYIYVGDVVPGPVTTMTQTAPFTSTLLAGKTMTFQMPSGTVNASFGSSGTVSYTDSNGNSGSVPWSIGSDGTLSVAGNMTYKIVGGAGNTLQATYINAKYFGPPVELGPITLQLN